MNQDIEPKPKLTRAHRRLMHWWNQLVNVHNGRKGGAGAFKRQYRFGFPLRAKDHPVINYPVAPPKPKLIS